MRLAKWCVITSLTGQFGLEALPLSSTYRSLELLRNIIQQCLLFQRRIRPRKLSRNCLLTTMRWSMHHIGCCLRLCKICTIVLYIIMLWKYHFVYNLIMHVERRVLRICQSMRVIRTCFRYMFHEVCNCASVYIRLSIRTIEFSC